MEAGPGPPPLATETAPFDYAWNARSRLAQTPLKENTTTDADVHGTREFLQMLGAQGRLR